MAGEAQLTMVGNVTNEPELRFIQSGKAVVKFRLASTPRRFDKQQDKWVDGDTNWVTVNAWGKLAENVAESVKKGDGVIVTGRLQIREFEHKGEKRTSVEVTADAIGLDLNRGTSSLQKAARASQGGTAAPADDPWATPAGVPGAFSDSPPF